MKFYFNLRSHFYLKNILMFSSRYNLKCKFFSVIYIVKKLCLNDRRYPIILTTEEYVILDIHFRKFVMLIYVWIIEYEQNSCRKRRKILQQLRWKIVAYVKSYFNQVLANFAYAHKCFIK